MSEATTATRTRQPASDLDLWSDEVLRDPYPHYRKLRDLGPAVWLSRHNAWVVPRYSSIRKALLDAQTFTSREGIAMNGILNQASDGIMLLADDPEHMRLRRTFARPLSPAAMKDLKVRLHGLASGHVESLMQEDRFDAVSQLAHFLPLTVVTELLGLSDDGKNNMLIWAAGLFDAMGPDGYPRTVTGLEIGQEAFVYLAGLKREEMDPDGWAAALFVAADEGKLSHQEAQNMLMDYTAPALDTTIHGLSSTLYLLGNNPDQWALLKENRDRVPFAIDEALRMESPIRAFTRVLTKDHDLEGVRLYAGDRAIMQYAAANRDERHYPEPDRFDVMRDARDHNAFGYGTHMCAGRHLGKLEIETVLRILLDRMDSFVIVEERRELHNTLRGLSKLVIQPQWA